MVDRSPAVLDRCVRTIRSTSNNIKNFGGGSEKKAFLESIKIFNKTPKKSLGLKSPNEVVNEGYILSPWIFLSGQKIRHFNYKENKIRIDRKMIIAKKQMKTLTPVRISRTKIKAIKKNNTFKKRSLLAGWTKEVYYIFAHKSKIEMLPKSIQTKYLFLSRTYTSN